MKSYESIGHDILSGHCYCFDKLDGSNVRAEWNPKKGFHKFGTRTQLIDENSDPRFTPAIPLMKEQEDVIGRILKDTFRAEEATCFFEFYGPNSFAGVHKETDPKKTTLIDVSIYKKGLINPGEFIKEFLEKGIETASLLHTGNLTELFIESVRDGSLKGMTFEGVVAKQNRAKTHHPPKMTKIKSREWIKRVKELYQNDPKLLKELL